MNQSIIKYTLLGALLSFVVGIATYAADMGLLPLIVFGLMFVFIVVAGFLAISEIHKAQKAEALSKVERAKVRKMFLVSLFLLTDFEFLLFFLDYQVFFEELAATDLLLSKVVYAGLCIGCGISGAMLMKATVLEYCGPKRYAQLNWAVRVAYLLIWFCLWSRIHF